MNYSGYIKHNLGFIYSLSKDEIHAIEGEFFEYEVTLESKGWFLRDRQEAIKENPLVDQWAVRKSRDAHILIIGENISSGQSIDVQVLKESVIDNSKLNFEKFKIVEEFGTSNNNYQGRILHTKANIKSLDLEYLYGLYVIGDKAFQVICCCQSTEFHNMRNIFIHTINSFKFTGQIRTPVRTYDI